MLNYSVAELRLYTFQSFPLRFYLGFYQEKLIFVGNNMKDENSVCL